MKKVLFFTVLILLLTSTAYAQKVFSVQYENQADVKVFVVNYENQADRLLSCSLFPSLQLLFSGRF